ncbi:hypothetical protein TNCV_2383221 [Trichonephila clavipes]|nr:hypothetical protein TNCV_2383221 [Trichonephila clavipes]
MSHLDFFAHANVFFTMVVNLSLSNCRLLAFRRIAKTAKDSRANRYFCPDVYPSNTYFYASEASFVNRGLIVIKGSDQRKVFEKFGLFTINLKILPYIRDLNDPTLPDHLHDEVHEVHDISECTMESY